MTGGATSPFGRESWPPGPPGGPVPGGRGGDDTPPLGDYVARLMRNTADMLESASPERIEEITGVVGEGESADGVVRLSYSEEAPVTGVRLLPKALELGTEDLAERVREAVRAAMGDQLARRRERTAGGDHGIADLAEGMDAEAGQRQAEDTARGMTQMAQGLFASVNRLRAQGATRPESTGEPER